MIVNYKYSLNGSFCCNFWKVEEIWRWRIWFYEVKKFISRLKQKRCLFSAVLQFLWCRPHVHIYFSSCQFETRSFHVDTCLVSLHNNRTFDRNKGRRQWRELRDRVLSCNAPCDRLTVLFLTKWETRRRSAHVCYVRYARIFHFGSLVCGRSLPSALTKNHQTSRYVVTLWDKIYTCTQSTANKMWKHRQIKEKYSIITDNYRQINLQLFRLNSYDITLILINKWCYD